MDNSLLAIFVTIGLSLLAVVITAAGYQRGRGPRHVVQGLGWVLVPVGMWLLGVTELLIEGSKAGYRWLMSTVMDFTHWLGAGLGGLGVLLIAASFAMKGRTKEEAKAARSARQITPGASSAKTSTNRAVSGGSKAVVQKPAAAAAPRGGADTDEDAEIEALLKKRGIN